jgi:radical SAM protein with 4Fe4S-binding SPASM domain
MNRKPLCSAGLSMCSLKHDGFIYPCHGFMYLNTTPFKFHMDELSADIIQKMQQKITSFRACEPEECKKCTVNFCARCNASYYSLSQKSHECERWFDKDSNDWVCKSYKLIDKAYRALKHLRGECSYGNNRTMP